MKVLKTTITIKKINIDLVFCPAKKLYWEYMMCKTCHCFKSNYNSYIECNFRKSEFSRSKSSNNTTESSIKGILVQNFSKNAENIQNMEMVINELSNNFKKDRLRKKLKKVPIAISQKI